MHELAAVLLNTEDLDLALHHVAVTARRTVPGNPHCSVTMTAPRASAAAGALAAAADEAQRRRGTGPCLDALRTGTVVTAPDLGSEHRWGGYPARALAQGVHSIVALPLTGRGALNLYSTRVQGFGPEAMETAELLAEHAGVLLSALLRRIHELDLIRQLREALESRTVIGQGVGIVMARERCSADAALTILRTVSQHRNIKLRQVAEEMVTDITGMPPSLGRFENS